MTVHSRRLLDSLAEGDHALRVSEGNGLDDVVALLASTGHHGKTKSFIDICRKHGAL